MPTTTSDGSIPSPLYPPVSGGTPVNVKVNYNNQGNPVGTRTNGNQVHKLIYQNGRVVRVDLLGADNLFHPKYTFLYDTQGRIIERQGQFRLGVLRWECGGTLKTLYGSSICNSFVRREPVGNIYET